MIIPEFDYFAPKSLDEALDWLAENRDKSAKILGGGTDLLVDIRIKAIPDGHLPQDKQRTPSLYQARYVPVDRPKRLMALSRIPGLRGIEESGSEIRIGAMTTISDLERSQLVKSQLRGLWDGAWQLGSPLVRNRGTFGGNLCNARPAADTSIPALALDGKLVLRSVRGERIIDQDDFVLAPGKTVIEPDEILTEIRFEKSDQKCTSGYIKLANRKSLEISVVGAAASILIDDDQIITSARVALGAVAPKPLLVPTVSDYMVGKELTTENITESARIASDFAKPITDHRGSEEYRNLMVEVLVRRVLNQCRERLAIGEAVV